MGSRRRLLTVFLSLAAGTAGAASASAAHAASWVPGPDVAGAGIAGRADMATDAAGVTTLVWSEDSGGGPVVVARRLAPGGTLGPRLPLGAGGRADVDVTPSGRAVVSWVEPGDMTAAVKLVAIGADGTVGTPVTVGTTLPIGQSDDFDLAVAPDGAAVVAWPGEDAGVDVRRIAADGSAAPTIELGGAMQSTPTRVAIGADGVAHVVWTTPDDTEPPKPLAARITAAGTLDGAPVQLAVEGYAANVVAGAGTALALWQEPAGASLGSVRAARLPSSGPSRLLPPVTLDSGPYALRAGRQPVDAAMAPDGAVTVIWTRQWAELPGLGASAVAAQLPAAGAASATVTLTPPQAGRFVTARRVARRGDGALAALWWSGQQGIPTLDLGTGLLTAAGTGRAGELAPRAAISTDGLDPDSVMLSAGGAVAVFAVAETPPGGPSKLSTAFLDDPPAPPDGSGGGPGPTPSPTPRARRAAARLKLTKAVRVGAKVTVAGTLDRRASGRVTIVWAQRAGRRTVRRTLTARIARARFSATLRLPRALARSSAAGRLTVRYAGDADTAAASVRRAVKPARRATARKRRGRGR